MHQKQTLMEFHTPQSTPYEGAELCDSCEDSAPGVYARHPPMEFHTPQSTPYGGAELCDSCEDSAPGVIASHPPMEFHTLQSTPYGEAELCDSYRDLALLIREAWTPWNSIPFSPPPMGRLNCVTVIGIEHSSYAKHGPHGIPYPSVHPRWGG